MREQIGTVLKVENIRDAAQLATALCNQAEQRKKHVQLLRDEVVFNIGQSGKRGAEIILDLLLRKKNLASGPP